jgi:hypothetical protein
MCVFKNSLGKTKMGHAHWWKTNSDNTHREKQNGTGTLEEMKIWTMDTGGKEGIIHAEGIQILTWRLGGKNWDRTYLGGKQIGTNRTMHTGGKTNLDKAHWGKTNQSTRAENKLGQCTLVKNKPVQCTQKGGGIGQLGRHTDAMHIVEYTIV